MSENESRFIQTYTDAEYQKVLAVNKRRHEHPEDFKEIPMKELVARLLAESEADLVASGMDK